MPPLSLTIIMSEILLTPLPEPISPIDPDVRPLARAASQSTEFFDSVFVDSAYSGTKPLRVVKKVVAGELVTTQLSYRSCAGNARSSTVSVPSSPVSVRSDETHPLHTISKLFLTMDLDRQPSVTYRSNVPLALDTGAGARATSSPHLTPEPKPSVRSVTSPTPPSRPRTRVPASPVTPTRAPAKALKLLGSQAPAQPPQRRQRKRDHFRPLPNATLVEIERFFGNAPKRPNKPSKAKFIESEASVDPKSRNFGGSATIRHQGEDGIKWLDVEDEHEHAWLMLDPSVRSGGRTDMGRYASDDEDWGLKAFASVLTSTSSKGKRVDESFVDLFGTEKVKSKPSKPRLKGKGRPSVPHPWSAAALADASSSSLSSPPALVARNVDSSSSGSSSSAPPSPDSDSSPSPPRRPKKRPPPLVLDLKPKSDLPIVILNSPPAHAAMKKPLTPIRIARPPSVQPAQTPFVHPRRAPRPIPQMLELDLTKAALPRSTDTRMPLLPPLPISMTQEDEFPISVFEPVTPTDAKYGQIELGDKKGGWLKKVVRDLGQVKL